MPYKVMSSLSLEAPVSRERIRTLKPSFPCQGTAMKGFQWVRPLKPRARQSFQLQNRGLRHQGVQHRVGGRVVFSLVLGSCSSSSSLLCSNRAWEGGEGGSGSGGSSGTS